MLVCEIAETRIERFIDDLSIVVGRSTVFSTTIENGTNYETEDKQERQWKTAEWIVSRTYIRSLTEPENEIGHDRCRFDRLENVWLGFQFLEVHVW